MENQLNTIIIDDEANACEALTSLFELYCPHIRIVATAHNLTDGHKAILQHSPDLVMLDIAIGVESGFDLFEKFISIDFATIFTSSFNEHAIRAFKVQALDYLLKPIDPQDLMIAIKKVQDWKRMHRPQWQEADENPGRTTTPVSSKGIAITTTEGVNIMDTNEIIHIEGSGSYSTFYLETGDSVIASRNLKYFEDLLSSPRFFRSHQSHLINLDHLRGYKSYDNQVQLTGSRLVPVAKSKKADLMGHIQQTFRS